MAICRNCNSRALYVHFFKKYRQGFIKVIKKHKISVIGLNMVNEIIDVVAKMAMNFAILLAPLALVWITNGFQPLFALLYGIILTLFFPKIIKENISKKTILQKLIFIVIIIIGGYLLN